MVERKRHLAKAVTYRVFGSAGTALVAYVFTGSAALGASVGVLDSVLKIGLYYVHERVWYRIKWGVRPPADTATHSVARASVPEQIRTVVVTIPEPSRVQQPAGIRD